MEDAGALLGIAHVLALFGLTGATGFEPARLEYAPPASIEACPSPDELRDAVSARLGYVVWRPDAARVVSVDIRAKRGGVAAVVRIHDPAGATGERALQAPSCPALAASVALAISIAIDPLSTGRPPPPKAPAPAAIPAPPKPEPALSSPPEPPAGPSLRVFGAVGVNAAFLAAPGVAPGARLQLGGRLGKLSLALEGRADLPTGRQVAAGGRVTSALLSVGLSPCWHVEPFAGCLIGAAGVLRADAEGLAQAQKGSAFHALVGARVAADWSMHRAVALRAQAEVGAVLTRIEIVDSQTGAAYWTTPPITLSLALMAVVDFL